MGDGVPSKKTAALDTRVRLEYFPVSKSPRSDRAMRKPLFSLKTHIGNVRKRNEDFCDVSSDGLFFAVADGIGGGPHGGIASRLAVKSAINASMFSADPYTRSVEAFFGATLSVQSNAMTKYAGMGTTLVTLAIDPGLRTVVVGHCGDSRCYMFRDGKLKRLTKDHSVDQRLTDAITTYTRPSPKFKTMPLGLHDLFLLCTDGVTGELTDVQIAGILDKHGHQAHPGGDAAAVVRAAVAGPGLGRDNATAVVAWVPRR